MDRENNVNQQQAGTAEPLSRLFDKKTAEEYTVIKKIGEGGFAQCYEVSSPKGERLAAKVVKKSDLVRSKTKQKLLSEIKIHQSLKHPNIVQFIKVFEDSAHVFIIMELCESKTCVELMKRKKRLTEEEARKYFLQTLEAVSYLHCRNVIHRDLKLGNLFLDANWNIKIGDFGLATVVTQEGERKKTVCGTPNYIAPEVLFENYQGHSFEADLWSMGVILYTMIIGKPPFQTSEVKAIYQNIKECKYSFPSDISISAEARDLVSSLLSPDPNLRPKIEDILQTRFMKDSVLRMESLSLSATTSSAPSSGSGMIDRMLHNLGVLLNTPNVSWPKTEFEDPSCHIEKWVDCTNKYGIGYRMTNGTIGVYFNDSTSIILYKDGQQFEYLEQEVRDNKKLIIKEKHTMLSYPAKLEKKATLLKYFSNYLSAPMEQKQEEEPAEADFLIKFMKTRHAMVFRLSNRLIQFNFFDHTKLLMYSEGNCIIFGDGKQELKMTIGELAGSIGSRDEVVQRLKYAYSVLNSLLAKRSKIKSDV